MRGTRWLILVAIAAILGGVGMTYRLQRSALEQQALPKPKALPLDLASSADEWYLRRTFPGEGRTALEIWAKKIGQSKDNSLAELENIELHIFHKEGGQYDRVKSARAEFSPNDNLLYSDGEVEITLGMPEEGQPRRTLVGIKSSGVSFDTTTGKASTDRPAEFVFENGTGKSVGASYDPSARELRMNNQVELNWKAPGPHTVPMRLECGDLVYQEQYARVWLRPWARLQRAESVIESGPALVTLEEGVIRKIEAQKAHGTDRYPKRALEYSAEELWAEMDNQGALQKIMGRTNARLLSTADATVTTVTADQVDMNFVPSGDESVLSSAVATGRSVLEARPRPVAGALLPETRLLRSDVIQVNMRAGGREIEHLETPGRGALEFVPNRPDQHHRTLNGDHLWIAYGSQNQIRSFRATDVETRTDPTPEERKRNRAVAITRSKNLLASFAPKTGQLSRVEQWDNFQYEEADRKAVAVRATLEQNENLLTLEKNARMWDNTGSTSSDTILLDQRTGNFTAKGHVNSSRLPDRKKPGSEMLSGDEPLQAIAEKLTATNHNRLLLYEGGAVLWQGPNTIKADRVEIDRERRRLTAAGNVFTRFLEQAQQPAGKAAAQGSPVFTEVRAAHLLYTDADRLAYYTGGALMSRPGLKVKAAEIRAWLAQQGSESRVDKAWADGKVEIAQAGPGRTRTGFGEHGEYYTSDQKLVLSGGQPHLIDSKAGTTRGQELTYFANDDRLLVTGAADQPAVSRIRRK